MTLIEKAEELSGRLHKISEEQADQMNLDPKERMLYMIGFNAGMIALLSQPEVIVR